MEKLADRFGSAIWRLIPLHHKKNRQDVGMGRAVDKLKWTMAINRARTLDEFVALGQKRGYRASWAYRAFAARLDMMENFQRDMDRLRKSWDEFERGSRHTARGLSPDRVVVQKPRQNSKTFGLGDPFDCQEGGEV